MNLTAREFLAAARIEPDATLSGIELVHVFWRLRGLEHELAKQQMFWASTNAALEDS